MKTTPFTEKHISLGAKMHEFAGYNMPIEYSGIIDEHLTVCQGVGVFDVSHMGEIWVKQQICTHHRWHRFVRQEVCGGYTPPLS